MYLSIRFYLSFWRRAIAPGAHFANIREKNALESNLFGASYDYCAEEHT